MADEICGPEMGTLHDKIASSHMACKDYAPGLRFHRLCLLNGPLVHQSLFPQHLHFRVRQSLSSTTLLHLLLQLHNLHRLQRANDHDRILVSPHLQHLDPRSQLLLHHANPNLRHHRPLPSPQHRPLNPEHFNPHPPNPNPRKTRTPINNLRRLPRKHHHGRNFSPVLLYLSSQKHDFRE